MRGSTQLDNDDYDSFLSLKAQGSRSARQELIARKRARREANDGIRGYHFGIADNPVYTESKEHFEHELDKRGLAVEANIRTQLHGPLPHEFRGRIQHGRVRQEKRYERPRIKTRA